MSALGRFGLTRLALRNLVQHKGKTLIVGVLIALGVAIMVIGSSVLDSASRSLQRSFTDTYTGQVVITGKARATVGMFGNMDSGSAETIPLLTDHKKITDYLAGNPEVKAVTSQVTGAEQLNRPGEDAGGGGPFVYLFGVDPSTYGKVFDNLDFVSGSFLQPGREGILMSTKQVQDFADQLGPTLKVGDKVLIQSFGNAIRQVTLRGIYTPRARNVAVDLITYIDPQTLRDLLGMAAASDSARVDPAAAALLTTSESDLFTSGQLVQAAPPSVRQRARAPAVQREAPSVSNAVDAGPWQFVMVNLRSPGREAAFIASTNRWLDSQGISARAEDWRAAAGPFAMIPTVIGMVFNAAVIIIAVVAVIIIMNTLVVSIGERTSEIGTMRALGARKGFVWRMLFVETLAISVIFGVAGILVGSAVVGVLNAAGLRGQGMLLQMIAGGSVLRPTVAASALGSSIVLVILVALVAHIYPVRTALRIQPVVAIQSRSE